MNIIEEEIEYRRNVDFKSMRPDERKTYLRNIYVKSPYITSIFEQMKFNQKESKSYQNPQCLYIYGQPGVGKTNLCRRYAERFPRYDVQNKKGYQKIVPVVYSKVEPTATEKSLAMALLRDLGDPLYLDGTEAVKTSRLVQLVKDCKVELILLDEVQHIYDKDSEKIIQKASNWIKKFIEDSLVPVYLIGLPDIVSIIEANEQLESRYQHGFPLDNLSMIPEGKEETSEFENFLYMVDLKLPFTERSNLVEMADIFYEISKGNLRILMEKIIITAAIKAINQNMQRIDKTFLQKEIDFLKKVKQNNMSITHRKRKNRGKGNGSIFHKNLIDE